MKRTLIFIHRSRWKIDGGQPIFGSRKLHQEKIQVTSTFNRENRSILNVSYVQKTSGANNLNIYCCGPTVYADSHLGHAITYVRCDLIVGMLKHFCNANVYLGMNITDIDDKIIKKSNDLQINYRQLSHQYFESFVNDLNALKIRQPDTFLQVSDHVDVIIDYIKRIFYKGFAYINLQTGDVNFDYEKFIKDFSICNEVKYGGSIIHPDKSRGKRSPKDFTLWKVSKPHEPKWTLKLNRETFIVGRPGWHVECSALSYFLFGSKLDIHFGGYDLIFPHHHCESCCSHAYLYETNSIENRFLYSSSNVWLHSGHLILRSEKMSKSLSNVILIKDFLQTYSPNIIRLLCMKNHYRTEIDFDEKVLQQVSLYDQKLRELTRFIEMIIYKLSSMSLNDENMQNFLSGDSIVKSCSLGAMIDNVEQQVWQGIMEDFDLNLGLEALINLAAVLSNTSLVWWEQENALFQCLRLRAFLRRWFEASGLDYAMTCSMNSTCSMAYVDHLAQFRTDVRQNCLEALNVINKINKPTEKEPVHQQNISLIKQRMVGILDRCDRTRSFLEKQGVKLKDQKWVNKVD